MDLKKIHIILEKIYKIYSIKYFEITVFFILVVHCEHNFTWPLGTLLGNFR